MGSAIQPKIVGRNDAVPLAPSAVRFAGVSNYGDRDVASDTDLHLAEMASRSHDDSPRRRVRCRRRSEARVERRGAAEEEGVAR